MVPQTTKPAGEMNQYQQYRDSDEAPDRQNLMDRVTAAHFLDDDVLDCKQKLAGTHDRYRLQQGADGGSANQVLMMSSS